MITIANKQVRISGRKIILADTPESRLKYLDYLELDLLAELGVNAITCTVFGGDVTDITPFKNNTPSSGIDYFKLDQWGDYLKYANSKGIVPFLLLSEKENHFALTEAQHLDLLYRIVLDFWDIKIIWQREELPKGQQDYIRKYFGYLKERIAIDASGNHFVAIHNNTDEDNFTGLNAYIDLVGLQTKLATGNSSISKAFNAGFAVFQSELVGGSASSDWKGWCRMGQGMSSGAGAYFQSDDLKAPQYVNNRLKYEPQYKVMVSELIGNVPTPKNKVILTYDTTRINVITE